MISFLMMMTSKVAVDSILAGAGLGMSIYKTVKAVRPNSRENRKGRRN